MLDADFNVRPVARADRGICHDGPAESCVCRGRRAVYVTSSNQAHANWLRCSYASFVFVALVVGMFLILGCDIGFVFPCGVLSPQASCSIFWIVSVLCCIAYTHVVQSRLPIAFGETICDAVIWCCGLYLILKCSYLWLLQPVICLGTIALSVLAGVFSLLYLRTASNPFANCCLVFARSVVALMLGAALVSLAIECGLYVPMRGAPLDAPSEQKTLQDNVETVVLMLNEDQWSGASYQEKLDAMQVVAAVQSAYLGVDEPCVEFSLLEASTVAKYAKGSNDVRINVAHRDMSGKDALIAIAHELAHCYEWACLGDAGLMESTGIELSPEQLKAMSYELEGHYVRKGRGYYDQECERFARAYAQASVLEMEEYTESWRRANYTTVV